jgi:hypothetical protein
MASVVVAVVAPFAIGAELKPYPLYFFVWFLLVVGFFTVLVALPIYISLPPHYRTRLVPLLAAGFVAAGFSFTLLEVLFIHSSFEQFGETVLVRGGWRTLAGWRFLLKHSFLMGCAGAIGGAAFWAVRRLTIGWSDSRV